MPHENTKHDKHLPKLISCHIYDRNRDNTVCDFYQRNHGFINEFRASKYIYIYCHTRIWYK